MAFDRVTGRMKRNIPDSRYVEVYKLAAYQLSELPGPVRVQGLLPVGSKRRGIRRRPVDKVAGVIG